LKKIFCHVNIVIKTFGQKSIVEGQIIFL